jgi:hypothetical protein
MVYDKKEKLHIVSVVAVIKNSEGKYLVIKRHEKKLLILECILFLEKNRKK